jgi:chloramphenicol 3-O-phosphotransferase
VIFLISGTPGSGKSSVAKALMQRFQKGVHLPVDDLREMVVSGIAHPVPTWTEETGRQFALARKNAVQMALNYSSAGFSVAIDDVFSTQDFETDYAPYVQSVAVKRILLLPTLEVALRRNAERTHKDFHPETLESVIKYLHAEHSSMNKTGWVVVDSSSFSIAQTVTVILEASNRDSQGGSYVT